MSIKDLIINGNLTSFADDKYKTAQIIKCNSIKFVFCRMSFFILL
jgi:hypothetical protein